MAFLKVRQDLFSVGYGKFPEHFCKFINDTGIVISLR